MTYRVCGVQGVWGGAESWEMGFVDIEDMGDMGDRWATRRTT